MPRKKRTSKRKKKDKRFKEYRVVNQKNIKETYDRLLEYTSDDSYIIIPKNPACRLSYNIIRRELLDMGALEVVEEKEYGNYIRVRPNRDFQF